MPIDRVTVKNVLQTLRNNPHLYYEVGFIKPYPMKVINIQKGHGVCPPQIFLKDQKENVLIVFTTPNTNVDSDGCLRTESLEELVKHLGITIFPKDKKNYIS